VYQAGTCLVHNIRMGCEVINEDTKNEYNKPNMRKYIQMKYIKLQIIKTESNEDERSYKVRYVLTGKANFYYKWLRE
jgi:hypothetical protein